MNNPIITKLDKLISEADQSLLDSQTTIQILLSEGEGDEPLAFEIEARIIQLILEYRLNAEDALAQLLNLDHHLLYILGIQPQHSAKANMERLAYALGSDDLKNILHTLSQLVDYLLRIARRYQKQQEKTQQHRVENQPARMPRQLKGMQKLVTQQKVFIALVADISKNLEQLTKLEPVGPVLDHIAGLRGPISRFYQAMQNGITATDGLYKQINKTAVLDETLGLVLKQAEQVLQQLPPLQPQPLHQLGHFAEQTTTEQLEQRAAAKRMRPFFNH